MDLRLNNSLTTSLMSSPFSTATSNFRALSLSTAKPSLSFPRIRVSDSQSVSARKSRAESAEPAMDELVSLGDEEDGLFDEEDEFMGDDDDVDDFDYAEEDEYEEEEDIETQMGDGEAGGGISLAGTWWDKKALEMAQEVSRTFDGELDIYAFKTLSNSAIRVRVENVTKKSGSPSIEDIEAFTRAYRSRLDEAELAKSIPENIFVEVSSPGVERVVRIPQDLDRFKERAMYVKYVSQDEDESSLESDGIFTLVSFDTDTKRCTWGIANVRVNREKAGKGRPLNKKQRDWRLDTPFESLHLVRLYSDI